MNTKTTKKPSFLLLFLLISFGSVSAVLFTPALPEISQFFQITDAQTQWTITIFLAGYAIGQLLYGPLGNGLGRKKALYSGIIMAIFSCVLCLVASALHAFWLLVIARFIMAIGSSVGLQMIFTLVADAYEAEEGRRIVAYAMMSFAITPGIGVALGGVLTTYFGWQSCFVALLIYGFLLLLLVKSAPETAPIIDRSALSPRKILRVYREKFQHFSLISGGLLMGLSSSCNYIFVAMAPFIAAGLLAMDPADYGFWSLLPPLGIIAGTQFSARCSKRYSMRVMILMGLSVVMIGSGMMLFFLTSSWVSVIGPVGLFLPQTIIFFGAALVIVNASARAMQSDVDKSNASAVMNFMSMGTPTVSTLLLSCFHLDLAPILPISMLFCAIIGFVLMRKLGN